MKVGCTYPLLWHWIEVNGQPYARAAVPPDEVPQPLTEQETGLILLLSMHGWNRTIHRSSSP